MITKITFIYETAIERQHFADANPDLMAVARAIPGFQRVKTPRAWSSSLAVLLRRDRAMRGTSIATGEQA